MRPTIKILSGVMLALVLVARAASGQQRPAAAPELVFTPYHANGTYDVNEIAGWIVAVAPGQTPPVTTYTYTARKNNLDVIKTGTIDVAGGRATIEASMAEPGMLYVQIAREGARPMSVGAAIAPTKIAPAVPRPADFDEFWDRKLAALAAVPINPLLTPKDTGVAGVDTWVVKLDSLNSNVQGYLAKPSREGKFPALVIYQYAGVYALNTKTSTDRAAEGWLVFNVDSHDMPPDQATAPRDYREIGNTDRETSYFLNMYLRDARAIDYVRTRPDWDGKTVVLMGTSMGGQQSLVTGALRPEVTAIIVNEPSGADSNGDLHGRRAGYPNWKSSDAAVMKTALYFDTVNFAPRIKAPAVISMGFIDTIAPPVGIWTVVNQIPLAEAVPMVESDHNNITPDKQDAYNSRSKEVLALILNGGTLVPRKH